MIRIQTAQRAGNRLAYNPGVSQRQPDMLIIFDFVIFAVVFVRVSASAFGVPVIVRLHSLDEFLLFDGIAQRFHAVYDFHIRIDRPFQRVIHPFVRLAADIDQ